MNQGILHLLEGPSRMVRLSSVDRGEVGDDLPFDHLGALKTMLGMYKDRYENVLVQEAIANALDAKADNIRIRFEENKDGYYIIFANDAEGMTEEQFIKYHTVALSNKVKGEGIGFAGVGAKIYLAADSGTKITTITRGPDGKVRASIMYRADDKIKYATSDKLGLKTLLGSANEKSFTGTTYEVRLNFPNYRFLKKHLEEIIIYWFNTAILTGKANFFVEGRKLDAWEPKGHAATKILSHKGQKIECYCYVSDEKLEQEEQEHIIFTVFGKRIRIEPAKFSAEIKNEYSERVLCIADVSLLAGNLLGNKQEFEKKPIVATVRTMVNEEFYKYLQSEGCIRSSSALESGPQMVSDAYTQKLDELLRDKKYRFLIPWSNPRDRTTITPDTDGDITITETDGQQEIQGKGKGGDQGAGISTLGGDDGKGFEEDEDGNQLGTKEKKKSAGLSVIDEEYPEDLREAWIDMENKGVLYNTGHKLAQRMEEAGYKEQNRMRVVVMELIKHANDKQSIDARQGMELFQNIYTEIMLNSEIVDE